MRQLYGTVLCSADYTYSASLQLACLLPIQVQMLLAEQLLAAL